MRLKARVHTMHLIFMSLLPPPLLVALMPPLAGSVVPPLPPPLLPPPLLPLLWAPHSPGLAAPLLLALPGFSPPLLPPLLAPQPPPSLLTLVCNVRFGLLDLERDRESAGTAPFEGIGFGGIMVDAAIGFDAALAGGVGSACLSSFGGPTTCRGIPHALSRAVSGIETKPDT